VEENGAAKTGAAPARKDGRGADEAARVLSRLERIETLDREQAPAKLMLGELRELVHEAEAWARVGGPERSHDAGLDLAAAGSTDASGAASPASRPPGGEGAPGGPDAEVAGRPANEPKLREGVEGMR
jgi:hypothetical protein